MAASNPEAIGLSGWGNYPKAPTELLAPQTPAGPQAPRSQ